MEACCIRHIVCYIGHVAIGTRIAHRINDQCGLFNLFLTYCSFRNRVVRQVLIESCLDVIARICVSIAGLNDIASIILNLRIRICREIHLLQDIVIAVAIDRLSRTACHMEAGCIRHVSRYISHIPIGTSVACRINYQSSLIQVHFLGNTNHDIVVGQISRSRSHHVITISRCILSMGTFVLQCFGHIIGHFDQLIDSLAIFIGGIHRIFGVSIDKSGQIVSGFGIFLYFLGLTINPMDIFRIHRQVDFIQGNIGIIDRHIIVIIGQRAFGLDFQNIPSVFHIVSMVSILIGIGGIRQIQLFQQIFFFIPIQGIFEVAGIAGIDFAIVRGYLICIHCSFGPFQGHRRIFDRYVIVFQRIGIGHIQHIAIILAIACVLHMIGPVIFPVPVGILIGIGLIRQPQIRNQLICIISVQSFCRIIQLTGVRFIHRTIGGSLPIRIHNELGFPYSNGSGSG